MSIYYGACAFNFNCKTIQFTIGKISSINVVLRSLFEGAQYNSEAGAKCAVYSRARTKQGREVIKEIRYIYKREYNGSMLGLQLLVCAGLHTEFFHGREELACPNIYMMCMPFTKVY